MATVKDLLRIKGNEVYSISAKASIHDALILMAEKDIGALPVMDGEKLVGIFSERDFARLLAKSADFSHDTPLSQVMTTKVFTISPSTNTEECMQLMTEKHIRHLPVLEKDRMIGLVSVGDVVKAVINTQGNFIKQLEEYISGSW